jgi:hypothetical protein
MILSNLCTLLRALKKQISIESESQLTTMDRAKPFFAFSKGLLQE